VIYIYKHIVRRRKEESFFLQRTERCKERDSLEQERLTVRRSRREEEEGSVGFASSSCCLIIRRKNNKDTHIHTHTKRERERERERERVWRIEKREDEREGEKGWVSFIVKWMVRISWIKIDQKAVNQIWAASWVRWLMHEVLHGSF
jgi:hypothetical protein